MWLHVRLSDARLVSLLSFWESQGANRFKTSDNAAFVDSAVICCACVCRRDAGDIVLVVP